MAGIVTINVNPAATPARKRRSTTPGYLVGTATGTNPTPTLTAGNMARITELGPKDGSLDGSAYKLLGTEGTAIKAVEEAFKRVEMPIVVYVVAAAANAATKAAGYTAMQAAEGTVHQEPGHGLVFASDRMAAQTDTATDVVATSMKTLADKVGGLAILDAAHDATAANAVLWATANGGNDATVYKANLSGLGCAGPAIAGHIAAQDAQDHWNFALPWWGARYPMEGLASVSPVPNFEPDDTVGDWITLDAGNVASIVNYEGHYISLAAQTPLAANEPATLKFANNRRVVQELRRDLTHLQFQFYGRGGVTVDEVVEALNSRLADYTGAGVLRFGNAEPDDVYNTPENLDIGNMKSIVTVSFQRVGNRFTIDIKTASGA